MPKITINLTEADYDILKDYVENQGFGTVENGAHILLAGVLFRFRRLSLKL